MGFTVFTYTYILHRIYASPNTQQQITSVLIQIQHTLFPYTEQMEIAYGLLFNIVAMSHSEKLNTINYSTQ